MKATVLLICLVGLLHAKDLGKQGETFPILEEDLLLVLKQWMREHPVQIEEEQLLYPPAVPGIEKVARPRSFSQSLPNGANLPYLLLFFDGTDPEQIAWAKRQPEEALWILVNGNPLEIREQEDREVFFDQEGVLTAKLKILQVPARVSQQERELLIEEERP